MVQMELLDQLAARVGLYPAILLLKVRAWTRTNERKGQQQKGGRYWMYNSITSWHEQIPYVSEKQIRTAMNYLRSNGYLLAEKKYKHKWNQTLHYALSDAAIELFQKMESDSVPEPIETPISSNESAPQNKSFSPYRNVDLPPKANDHNALPNPLPCNDMIPPPPNPGAFSCSEEVSRDDFVERLKIWNIPEPKIRSFLQRTGRSEIWVYRWLGIMAEDIRSGYASEYRSPLGALMMRHKENWPFPQPFKASELAETIDFQKTIDATKRSMLKEYESMQPDPASLFYKLYKKSMALAPS